MCKNKTKIKLRNQEGGKKFVTALENSTHWNALK